MLQIITGYETEFLMKIIFCLISGFIIGSERESRKKSAGISTQCLVIGGSMIFTFLSLMLNPNAPTQMAGQVITGVGFLGAGIILRNEKKNKITNLTTAASIWFSAAIGMTIGFGWYSIALLATVYSVTVPRIPHMSSKKPE